MKRNMIFMLSKLVRLLTREPKVNRDFKDVADRYQDKIPPDKTPQTKSPGQNPPGQNPPRTKSLLGQNPPRTKSPWTKSPQHILYLLTVLYFNNSSK